MLSRDRVDQPDGIQVLGKSLFSRRVRARRSGSSSGTSISYSPGSFYPAEPYPELALPPPTPTSFSSTSTTNSTTTTSTATTLKDHQRHFSSIFGRRKPSRSEPIPFIGELSPSRKLQISTPYNFQHVTHTCRHELPGLRRGTRIELASDLSSVQAAQSPSAGALKGIQASDLHPSATATENISSSSSSSSTSRNSNSSISSYLGLPSVLLPRGQMSRSGGARMMPQSRSSDQLRGSPPPRPPRPSRPFVDQDFNPPTPPPRTSSRHLSRGGGGDPFGGFYSLERPATSAGFRHPQPFAIADIGLVDMGAAFVDPVSTVPSMVINFDKALPDVPEEEERDLLQKKCSRASMISITGLHSSLKGSHSVPLIKRLIEARAEASQTRPASGTSETLGSVELLAAQSAMEAAAMLGREGSADNVAVERQSWEDCVDYCYEHEADADFDYEWTQSFEDEEGEEKEEADRDVGNRTPVPGFNRSDKDNHNGNGLLPTPRDHDLPALSPASQTSTSALFDMDPATPTDPFTSGAFSSISNNSNNNNTFSLRGPKMAVDDNTPISPVSTLDDSGSFTFPVSPNTSDFGVDFGVDNDERQQQHDPFGNANLLPGRSGRLRSSTSTATTELSRSDTVGSRNFSTSSSRTSVTRITCDSTGAGADTEVSELGTAPLPSPNKPLPDLPSASSENVSADGAADVKTSQLRPTTPGHQSRASESSATTMLSQVKSKDQMNLGRRRARTTSLSSRPAPAQYALFPPSYLSGNRS